MEPLPRPKSWIEVTKQLMRKGKDHRTGRFRPIIAFRGLSDSNYRLETGVQRLIKRHEKRRETNKQLKPIELSWVERRLIDTFKMYAFESFDHTPSDWEVLQLGQH